MVLGLGIGTDRSGEFSCFGESPDPKRHGEMLDEGLEVLVKLWSGETFSYEGKYYQISQTRFLPVPVQHPRIPLWIAVHWPHKRPLRRAARWDGICFLKVGSELTPAELGEIQAYLALHPTSTTPFAVVASGRTTGTEKGKDATKMAQLADVGVTWWQEYFGWQASLEEMRQRIHHGPPRFSP